MLARLLPYPVLLLGMAALAALTLGITVTTRRGEQAVSAR
jgi:hypothetical protein